VSIDYDRFARVIARCIEVGEATDANPVVSAVYKATLEAEAKGYLAKENAFTDAKNAFAKENGEAVKAFADLDAPYRVARSALVAILPHTQLPDTLKAQPTDTDKLNAISRLIDLIDDHSGEAWADNILAGDFGVQAPAAVTEMREAMAANTDLSKAQLERAAAYGPTYEKYIRFKGVVRNAYGTGSKQYRRIHLRALPGAAPEEPEVKPEPKPT